MRLSSVQILIIRLAIAALFLSIGPQKIQEGWLRSAEFLNKSLNNYHQKATGPELTYLDDVAIPHAEIWSKLIPIGETAVGISLLLGLLTRFSSLTAMFMVINFHAANGNLFSLNFFSSPWAGILLAGLLVVFLARGGRWLGVDVMLARSRPNGILW